METTMTGDSGADEGTTAPSPIGYLADAPVTDPADDRFRRQPFAHRIADTIADRPDPTSLVVGLYGKWGEGKTTVLNFIEDRLEGNENVVCVRFNPWLYQSDSQLLLSFFETLASAVERSLASTSETVGKWLRTLGAALGTVSVGIGIINATPGTALQSLGESLSSVDVQEKRKTLEKLLKDAGKRILIMIDDIDRLDDGEIATVFKLVKLAADFDHTAYILAFDQQVVAKALAKRYSDTDSSGTRFIEKIVQVPLELPPADPSELQTMTLQAMTAVLTLAGIELDDADVNRFSTGFGRHLGPYIGTPRMAKRVANAIEFVVPLVAGEVNVTDMLLVETFRVLFPTVYRKLPAKKDALLGKAFDYGLNGTHDLVKADIEPLFEGLDSKDADHVKGLLRELFPRIERLYSNYHYGQESIPGWHAAQRICAPDYFDRYFSYGIPIGDLADAELRSFLEHLHEQSEEEAAGALDTLFKLSTPKRVVEKLRPLEATFDPATSRALVFAIADRSDVIPDLLAGPMSGITSPFGQAAMHIANVVAHMPSDQRPAVLRRIIESSASLAFASDVLRWSRTLSGDDVAPEARSLTPEEIKELESALADRIAVAAGESPFFLSMPRYAPSLYYAWMGGAGRTPVEDHLTALCTGNLENALALVRAFMPTAWSMETGMPVGSQVERNTYDSIAGLMDPQVITDTFVVAFPIAGAQTIPEDTSSLGTEERIALRWALVHRVAQAQTVTTTTKDDTGEVPPSS
jgi:hypothetical protein